MQEFYVYTWFYKDTNKVFYVGKGCGNRYKDVSRRNKIFKQIYNTNPENCAVVIVKYFQKEEDAFAYEEQLIQFYWNQNEAEANIDKGGIGGYKMQWTPKLKQYLSQFNPMYEIQNRMWAHQNPPMHNPDTVKKVLLSKNLQVMIDDIIYITIADASRQLHVAQGTIRLWIKRGTSPTGKPCYLLDKKRDQQLKSTYTNNQKHNSKAIIIDGIQYPSIKAGAEAINGKIECLSRCLLAGKMYKGHTCSYANQQPSQENNQ